jgi:acetyl-CoA carboxylase biotin carboxylase subunit
MKIDKVLVANRGEIAVRVIRACREQGIASVAVFSEADREALHVLMADEAYPIGPPAPAESYLAIDKLVRVAKASGADAVHPGYGFLAENAAFAEACGAAGLVFVGPPPAAIRALGDKTAARRIAHRLGVPTVPGTFEPVSGSETMRAAAREIGYPLMVKAAMGGGGKGMRVVRSENELENALALARSEAAYAFGDGAVYLERYLAEPRHIEVQVLADSQGHVIHLGERECSIQRRHQKLVEESPSPFVDGSLRERLGEAACRVAGAAGYVNAGTVEFLVDAERNFYFLEMNTRLQVEHGVTELVTGIDLVREQLRIAAGDALAYRQADVVLRGAAIECRINAEDPFSGWMPSPGRITGLRAATGPWVRDDSGAYEGYTIPRFYDTLLAKLMVWGVDREAAISRMTRALAEYKVVGVLTTIPVLAHIVAHADFRAGKLSTGFLDRILPSLTANRDRARSIAIIAAVLAEYERLGRTRVEPPPPSDNWRLGRRPGWR